MSVRNAYAITDFCKSALSRYVPILEWEKVPDKSALSRASYSFDFHRGSAYVKDHSKPFAWLPTGIVSTFLLTLFGFLLQRKKEKEPQLIQLCDEQISQLVVAMAGLKDGTEETSPKSTQKKRKSPK